MSLLNVNGHVSAVEANGFGNGAWYELDACMNQCNIEGWRYSLRLNTIRSTYNTTVLWSEVERLKQDSLASSLCTVYRINFISMLKHLTSS